MEKCSDGRQVPEIPHRDLQLSSWYLAERDWTSLSAASAPMLKATIRPNRSHQQLVAVIHEPRPGTVVVQDLKLAGDAVENRIRGTCRHREWSVNTEKHQGESQDTHQHILWLEHSALSVEPTWQVLGHPRKDEAVRGGMVAARQHRKMARLRRCGISRMDYVIQPSVAVTTCHAVAQRRREERLRWVTAHKMYQL